MPWHRLNAYLKLGQCAHLVDEYCSSHIHETDPMKIRKFGIVIVPALQLSGIAPVTCAAKYLMPLKLLLLFKHVESLSQSWMLCICKEANFPQASVSDSDWWNSAISSHQGDLLWEWLRHCSIIHETLKSLNISTNTVTTYYPYFYTWFFMVHIVHPTHDIRQGMSFLGNQLFFYVRVLLYSILEND